MRTILAWFGAAIWVVAGCGEGAADPLSDVRAVVVNSLSEDLSVIGVGDPPPVQKSVRPVGSAPNQILQLGDELLVLNSTSNSLQAIDPTDWTIRREYSLGDGCSPFRMTPTADGRLLVTCWLSDELLLVDPHADMTIDPVMRRLALPSGEELAPFDPAKPSHARPQGVALIGHQAFVGLTNLGEDFFAAGPGLVQVVDVAAWTRDRLVTLGTTNPLQLAVTPDERLAVACAGAFDGQGAIELLSTERGDPLGRIELGGAPGQMWFDSAGVAWVGDNLEGQLLRFRLDDGAVLDPVVLCPSDYENGIYAFVADVAGDGRSKVYAACFATDRVLVFEPESDGLPLELEVGDGPTALLVTPR